MRVVRIYHGGRDAAHRARDRALVGQGVQLRLIVPARWPGGEATLTPEAFDVVELEVSRPGDVNRHRFLAADLLRRAVLDWQPDVVDLHEEPVSAVTAQALPLLGDLPVVMYTAQNLDKRWPPPFARHERQALDRAHALYPCSRQAASVVAGKGFRGHLEVLPLGLEPHCFFPGAQRLPDDEVVLGLVGRLVPEKGLVDAIEVLAAVSGTRLLVVGSGPTEAEGRALAADLGVADRIDWHPWVAVDELASLYRRMHVVLVPSRPTARWVEQFGRVITEGAACGAVPVGFDSGSIAEVVEGCGVVVSDLTTQTLAAAVKGLIDEPERWARLRETGLARSSGITWEAVARRHVGVYDRARAGARPGLGRPDRSGARREWGPPAATPTGDRPFALPVLRSSRLLGRFSQVVTSGT